MEFHLISRSTPADVQQILEEAVARNVELGFTFLHLGQTQRIRGDADGERQSLTGAREALLSARQILQLATSQCKARLERQIVALQFEVYLSERSKAGQSPAHVCDATCQARLNLDDAADALAESSALLSSSISSGSDEFIDKCNGLVRDAVTRVSGALTSYKLHLIEFHN